jgi:hypothetical protein
LSPKRSFSTQRTGRLYLPKRALTDRPHLNRQGFGSTGPLSCANRNLTKKS